NGFERIVFASWDLLESGGVHQDSHTGKGTLQTLRIADITDEVTQAGMIKARGSHIMLLQLVAAEDDKFLGMVIAQHQFREFLAEGSCRTRDQHNLFRPIHAMSLQVNQKQSALKPDPKSLARGELRTK